MRKGWMLQTNLLTSCSLRVCYSFCDSHCTSSMVRSYVRHVVLCNHTEGWLITVAAIIVTDELFLLLNKATFIDWLHICARDILVLDMRQIIKVIRKIVVEIRLCLNQRVVVKKSLLGIVMRKSCKHLMNLFIARASTSPLMQALSSIYTDSWNFWLRKWKGFPTLSYCSLKVTVLDVVCFYHVLIKSE